MQRQWMYGLGLAAIAAMLAGCGGGSGVGDQKSSPPVAWAKVLNHPFQRGSDGSVTVDVRAGSEVFLTGVDSNSTTLPVLRYEWQAGNAAAQNVRIVTRNVSTMSFTAPDTRVQQTLQFKLTVYDSNDVSDTATVTVNVEPFRDINGFLQYDGPPTFKVVPVTSAAVPLAHSVPFTIKVRRSITYWGYDGQQYTVPNASTAHPEDFEKTLTGSWSAQLGTGGADGQCGDLAKNPAFELPVPAIDMDDVLATLTPSQSDQQKAPDPSRIDEAQMEVTLSIEAPTFDAENQGSPATVGVCWISADSSGPQASARVRVAKPSFGRSLAATSASTAVNVTELLGPANGSWDTLASAQAYYATIDPDGSRDTFNKWLVANGFALAGGPTDWSTIESRSTAHAVYLNNFDLGFGRDMYMRVKSCDGGTVPPLGGSFTAQQLAALAGTCDIAGVVVNYASLEAAAKKIGPVLAVAMEYGATPYSGGKRITTFYTYAPDRNREFKLVHSANLDGRGERYLPQACTVCHGGVPFGRTTVDTDSGGDVHAGFMSWDLDSFLYSDTDPSFSNAGDPDFTSDEQALAAKYTRDGQEAALKKLNQMAYLTYGEGDGRFDFARELVAGWYHDDQAPDTLFARAKFNGAFVPTKWQDGQGYDDYTNPAGSAGVYQDVFARNCRACHVLQAPGMGNQLPMGSYRDFIGSGVENVLEQGWMPFARLTMDRFWVAKPGATSAADKLRQHLDPEAPGEAFADAGKAVVVLTGFPETLVKGQYYLLDASQSLFLATPNAWTLDVPPTPASGSLEKLSDTQALLSGVSDKGTYQVRLTDDLGATGTLSAPRQDAPITVTKPVGTLSVSVGPAVNVTVEWTGGDGATRLANVTSGNPSVVGASLVGYTNGSGTIQLTAKLLGQAQVSFDVIDADEDVQHHAFTVTTTKSLTLLAPTGYSETSRQLGGATSSGILKAAYASGSAALDLASTVSPPLSGGSDPVTFQLVNPPAGTTLVGTTVSYRPPVAYMTGYSLDGATPVRMETLASRPTLRYRACYSFYAVAGQCPTGDPTQYAEADIAVEVIGRGLSAPTPAQQDANSAGWQYVYDRIKPGSVANCAGCHQGPVTGGDTSPNWMGATDSASSTFDTACGWQADGIPNTTGANDYIVKPGNSAGSNLYEKAQGNWQHKDVDPGVAYGDQELWTALRNWIDDGAYYTGAVRTPQKCPARP